MAFWALFKEGVNQYCKGDKKQNLLLTSFPHHSLGCFAKKGFYFSLPIHSLMRSWKG